ncbi:hypothetical protein S83_043039 [Arachis hypogaea]
MENWRVLVFIVCGVFDNWSVKAIRRKTTDTGRMSYLHHVPCRFKSGFREGTEAVPRKKGAAASRDTIHGNRHHLGQALLEETKATLQVYKVSIGAACNLSWPADCLLIQVLDDSTEPAIKAFRLVLQLGYLLMTVCHSNSKGQTGRDGWYDFICVFCLCYSTALM